MHFQEGMKATSLISLPPFGKVCSMSDFCHRYIVSLPKAPTELTHRRYVSHAQQASTADTDATDNYWLEHFHHNKMISETSSTLLNLARQCPNDANVLFTAMNCFCGIICFNQGSMKKAKAKAMRSEKIGTECERKCLEASLKMANLVKSVDRKKINAVRIYCPVGFQCSNLMFFTLRSIRFSIGVSMLDFKS